MHLATADGGDAVELGCRVTRLSEIQPQAAGDDASVESKTARRRLETHVDRSISRNAKYLAQRVLKTIAISALP